MNYEAAYIQAVLLDPSVLRQHPVEPVWFQDSDHLRAFEICRDLAEDRDPNLIDLREAHPRGPAYVQTIFDPGKMSHLPGDLVADGLREAHQRRTLRRMGADMSRAAQDPTESVEEIVADVMGKLKDVGRGDSPIGDLNSTMRITMAQIERVYEAGGKIGASTGFELLDRIICGWEPEKLYFIAARPKAGKTAFALATITDALRQGLRVYFASLEMGASQVGMRILSAAARVNSMDIRRAQLTDESMGKISHAMGRLSKHNNQCLVDTRPRLTWEKIQASILMEHAQRGLGLVVVDYVQLMRMADRQENRAAELESIAYGLKDLAKEISAPVVALSQLNRDQDEDKPPSIDRMKGSGGLEQAADAVILLWRPDKHNRDTIEMVVGANRDGPTGKARIHFEPEYAAFS